MGTQRQSTTDIVCSHSVMASTYPQFVLLGDSLFQQSMQLQEGFSFQAALQTRAAPCHVESKSDSC